MKCFIYFFLFFVIPISAIAQEQTHEYGVITDAEWQLKSYEQDADAGAVILYDKGTAKIEESGTLGLKLGYDRSKRIKILAKSGYSEGEVVIPYLREIEEIIKITATTYNIVDGKAVKTVVEPETIFEEQFNEFISLKKFAFPDVQVGSILEYSYEISRPYEGKIKEWKFQNDIPTLYSEFNVIILPVTESYLVTQGIAKFDVQHEKVLDAWAGYENGGVEQAKKRGLLFNKDLIHRTYGLKNIPAFGDESYMTSKDDFIVKMKFMIADQREIAAKEFNNYANIWPAISKQMASNEEIGGFLRLGQKEASELIKEEFNFEGKSDNQKAKEIIRFVKNKYRHTGRFNKYPTQSVSSFLLNEEGNVADINLWLITLLRTVDIEANPIALSTRKHGKIKMEFPYYRDFNYLVVLVTIDGTQFLTDASEKYLPYNRIPPRCINGKGLVISSDRGGWVRLDNRIVSKDNILITINPIPDEATASIGLTTQSSVYNAYRMKSRVQNDEEKVKEAMIGRGFESIEKVKTFNYADNAKPYIVALKGNYELESIADKLIVTPFLDFPLRKNQLRQKERRYPIDFIYLSEVSLKSQIKIPEGYDIDTLPETISIDDELANIQLSYRKSGGQIIANGFYAFKKVVYPPEDYQQLKNYFNIIIDNFNQELILEK
ncbi:MAG: DUF3857 domain-containing protein [Bacteroidota bacterium]